MRVRRRVPRAARRAGVGGFTLVELMVVMAVIAILVTLAVPQYRVQMIAGRLEAAKPYLMSIAAAERVYRNRTGAYLATDDEQDIEDNLGVDLGDAGDFCFMVVTGGFITGGGDPDFEVWAVLRNGTATGNDAVTVENTAIGCVAADTKQAPSGWVQDSGEIGGAGRLVVLRYPAPADGPDEINLDTHRAAVIHDWVAGISAMDALQP